MKLLFKTLAVSVGVALFCSAAPAAITINHVGEVYSGLDTDGFFGASGADLSGKAYKLTFSIETSELGHYTDTGSVLLDDYEGRSASSFGTLTIDGSSYTLGGGYLYTFRQQYVSSMSSQISTSMDGANGSHIYAGSQTLNPMFSSVDQTTSFSYTFTDDEIAQRWSEVLWNAGDTHLTLRDTQVSSGAVPEPAAWAMMVGGFGLAGTAMRRRKLAAALS
jgi:hypothetical protein